MENNKKALIFSSFLILILAASYGCEKMEETPPTAKQPVFTPQMASNTIESESQKQPVGTMETRQTSQDTLAPQQGRLTVPSMEDLEERKSEIHSQLDSLIELLDEKEKALIQKEDSLNKQEQLLIKKEEELSEAASAISWHRIISWIILVIGIIAIIAGIAIGKSNKSKSNKPKTSDSGSKSQSESAKKESSQTGSKSRTQTGRKSKE